MILDMANRVVVRGNLEGFPATLFLFILKKVEGIGGGGYPDTM